MFALLKSKKVSSLVLWETKTGDQIEYCIMSFVSALQVKLFDTVFIHNTRFQHLFSYFMRISFREIPVLDS